MSIRTKWIALMTAVVLMLVGMQLYYGKAGTTTSQEVLPEDTFDWWIYASSLSEFFDNYSENPTVQYTLRRGWGPENRKIALNFLQPASGTERDNYSTMLASGDLPDIIDAVITDPPAIMVEKGYAMELTEYVEKYMPNYVALVHSNNEYYYGAVSVDEEGKEHYYSLISASDEHQTVFQGFMYRRDWIVKYGVHPVTGAAFTGGYTDENDLDSWVDEVMFPSWYDEGKKARYLEINPEWDGTTPVYISDWEWMFEIFTRAQADLGIVGKYSVSMYYPGFTWAHGLLSCFGGGICYWYHSWICI